MVSNNRPTDSGKEKAGAAPTATDLDERERALTQSRRPSGPPLPGATRDASPSKAQPPGGAPPPSDPARKP